jgi:ribonuclease Z
MQAHSKIAKTLRRNLLLKARPPTRRSPPPTRQLKASRNLDKPAAPFASKAAAADSHRPLLRPLQNERRALTIEELRALAWNIRMLNWVQIITTPTADTPGTILMLHFDNQRYLFGSVAEGTQRATVQRKSNIQKAENIFLSGNVNWNNAGGLMGMVLTLSDVIATQRASAKSENLVREKAGRKTREIETTSKLNIHGGKNLANLIATTRRFVFRKGLPLSALEIRDDPRKTKDGNEPDWEDMNIRVWYMPVEASGEAPAKSSRKRSHDEISGSDPAALASAATKATEDENHKLVLDIVRQMFNSNWSMDALTETTLLKAKLPAKLFVRDSQGHIQVYKGPKPNEPGFEHDIPVLVREPWPAAKHESLPTTQPSRQSICYVVKNHDRRGKFNPTAALKHGVAKQDFRILTSGGSVTGADGVVVTPDMVLEPTVPGQGFLLLDVPDASYIEPLLSRPELSNDEIMNGIMVAFWILGLGVVQDERLQAFMQKTAGALRHIVCSGDTSPNMVALESSAARSYKLHSIDPDRFPLLQYSNVQSLSQMPVGTLPKTMELGRTGKMVQFSPQYMHKDDQILPFPDIKKLSDRIPTPEDVEQLAEVARKKLRDPEFLRKIEEIESDIPNRDAEVITLGTGSALPSKYRNVSSTMVRVPGYGSYLFDAGENTLGQLRRVFGNDLPSVLQDLKVIWISHLHADHHLGTASIIQAWNEETSKSNPSATLHVASHVHMIDWLREYAGVEDYGFHRLTFSQFVRSSPEMKVCRPATFTAEETAAYGLERIDACFVDHCHGALATVFTWPSGLKVAYSGDCRPSREFARIGQGTTLLIHESTFDDELRGDALAKKHSTMSEAIDIGRKMNARRIMLTHFSQRYQKFANLEDSMEIKSDAKGVPMSRIDEVILAAFDHMRVKLGDFRKAQAFLPALQRLHETMDE